MTGYSASHVRDKLQHDLNAIHLVSLVDDYVCMTGLFVLSLINWLLNELILIPMFLIFLTPS